MSILTLTFFPYEIFIPLFSLIKQYPWYTGLFVLVYFIVGTMFFGYYDSKYGLGGPDVLMPLFTFFFWPIVLIIKIIIFIFSIPYHLGKQIAETIKGGL